MKKAAAADGGASPTRPSPGELLRAHRLRGVTGPLKPASTRLQGAGWTGPGAGCGGALWGSGQVPRGGDSWAGSQRTGPLGRFPEDGTPGLAWEGDRARMFPDQASTHTACGWASLRSVGEEENWGGRGPQDGPAEPGDRVGAEAAGPGPAGGGLGQAGGVGPGLGHSLGWLSRATLSTRKAAVSFMAAGLRGCSWT